MNGTDFQDHVVAGLHTYIWGQDENPGAPVVFVLHGLRQSLRSVMQWGADLADSGFIAIAIEQRNHGSRLIDWRLSFKENPNYAADTYGYIVGTSKDVSSVIDFLPAALGIAVDRVGITGISLGGHVSLLAMCHDPRITVGVPLIGSGDRLHQSRLRAQKEGLSEDEFLASVPAPLRELYGQYDPINNLTNFPDRPLCMINGGADEVVPLAGNQRLEAGLRKMYHEPERLRLSVYPGVGHEVNDEMWQECLSWFKRWL